jgi:hypothetical protein
VAGDFTQSLEQRIGGGRERKISGRLATANLLRDEGKGLKQKPLQKESAMQNIHATSQPSIAPIMYFRCPEVKGNTPRVCSSTMYLSRIRSQI